MLPTIGAGLSTEFSDTAGVSSKWSPSLDASLELSSEMSLTQPISENIFSFSSRFRDHVVTFLFSVLSLENLLCPLDEYFFFLQ